MATCNNSIIFS